MSPSPPPRPMGPHRPGSGKQVESPPERSISPAPEARRGVDLVLPSLEPAPVLSVGPDAWSEAPPSDPSIPPPPRRAREQTARGWPPPVQVFVGPQDAPRHHRSQDSEAPKSARQRASEALRSPFVQGLGMLLLGALGGGGGTLVAGSTKSPDPAPAATAAGEAYQALKDPVANLAADLSANDRADRAETAWTRDEFTKFDKRLAACEAKMRRAPRDELEPEPPPDAPKPPRTPKLRERLDALTPARAVLPKPEASAN